MVLASREPTGVRLFVRLQKILNSLVGILALTLIVLAAIVTAFELFLGGAPAFAREALDALAVRHVRVGDDVDLADRVAASASASSMW